MENNSDILIYQTEDGNTKIDVRLENETVWMTQKAIAELYQKGVNTINEHIKNIFKFLDEKNQSRYFIVAKMEGARKIKRSIIHYNIDVVYNIAVKGQYFEEFNKFFLFIRTNGINKEFLNIIPIKERRFEELLIKSLADIVEVIPQYRVDKYIADFYFPQLRLIVEYDEEHHSKQQEADQKRQRFLEEEFNLNVIRVKEGFELEGLNSILKCILSFNKDVKYNE